MIVREYAACTECGTPHVLRIGLGAEPVQAHHFACTSCGLDMGIRLEQGVGWTYGPNARKIEQDDTAAVVNLHPSFVFAKNEVGSAKAFPSLRFGRDMVKSILDAQAKAGLTSDLPELIAAHARRAPITEEWEHLRAAWSLSRNGKHELSVKRLAGFIFNAGYAEPPDTLAGWMFQFAGSLTQPYFEAHFEGLFQQLRIAKDKDDFGRFIAHYDKHMSAAHARRYFEACKAFLGAFSEFSQVHHLVTANVEISDDYAAASTNFDATRMIYGNIFEAFGDNMEVLIALNNVIEGRPFDQLRTITLAAYRQTDKAGRCRAIADNADMAAVCVEFDNQVRNASHHGGMIFDRVTGTVEYRFGKGGQGDTRTMAYATYLARSSRLFIQLMLLFRLEILLANEFGARLPL
ncbi:hypothetical protein [Chelatococcus asaccharovorans]|uniref:hypothetical protein n=1 Tax=Chelatococcus asaccharovorans TaxID=28210 RepID=UPI00224C73AF|nr:hypothetical protein [Chelatococcus asaccharovorans]CAH1662382.1 conserved hypothetical protein [Chelatococcus asaccharovorans]CAH1690355.1 conserved hypothetical protein [Chelatococcus asaccharovorans]